MLAARPRMQDRFAAMFGSIRGQERPAPVAHPSVGHLPRAAELTYTPFTTVPDVPHTQLDGRLQWGDDERFDLDLWTPADEGWQLTADDEDLLRAARRAWEDGAVFVHLCRHSNGGLTRDIIAPYPLGREGLREAVRRAYTALTGRADAAELRFAGGLAER